MRGQHPLFGSICAYIIRCKGSKQRMLKTQQLKRTLTQMGIKTSLFNCVNYKKEWLTQQKGVPNCTFGNIAKNHMFSWTAHTTPVEIAIAMSHKLVIRHFVKQRQGYSHVLVFEEDVILKPAFARNFNGILASILENEKTRTFGVFYLWNTNAMATRSKLKRVLSVPTTPPLPILKETRPHNAGCVAYLMSRKLAMKETTKAMWPIKNTSDLHLGMDVWKRIHRSMPFLSVLMRMKTTKRCKSKQARHEVSRVEKWTDHPCIESPLVSTSWYEDSTSHTNGETLEDFTMNAYEHKKTLRQLSRSCAPTPTFKAYLR